MSAQFNQSTETMSKLRAEYLKDIHEGTSPFKVIPSDIGHILYCDTSNYSKSNISNEEIRKKRLSRCAICLGAVGVIWLLFHKLLIFSIIITVVAIIVWIILIRKVGIFTGEDYFIGEKGFAKIKFEKDRKNIVSKIVILFDELSEVITGETYKKQNYTYVGTNYFFGFFGKPDEKGIVDLILEVSDNYHQEKPTDAIWDIEYLFWKEVEKHWTNYKFLSIQDELLERQTYSFNLMSYIKDTNKWMATPYITFDDSSITVKDIEYNKDTLKNIYFNNGMLVIEHINHKTKLLGLISKGNVEHIPLTNVGNKLLFMKFLNATIRLQ